MIAVAKPETRHPTNLSGARTNCRLPVGALSIGAIGCFNSPNTLARRFPDVSSAGARLNAGAPGVDGVTFAQIRARLRLAIQLSLKGPDHLSVSRLITNHPTSPSSKAHQKSASFPLPTSPSLIGPMTLSDGQRQSVAGRERLICPGGMGAGVSFETSAAGCCALRSRAIGLAVWLGSASQFLA
jgi:hypothetical protein